MKHYVSKRMRKQQMRYPGACEFSSGSPRRELLLAGLSAEKSQPVRKCLKSLEARVGFEPTNGGFADLSLGPLGYRAEPVIITKLGNPLGRLGLVAS